MLFDVTLTVDKVDLQRRFVPTLSDGEHTEIIFLPDEPEATTAFLDRIDRMAPVAEAALLLHARRVWGREWYDQLCAIRFGRVPVVKASFGHK